MALTPAQLPALKAAILAETDPAFVEFRDNGDNGQMAAWYNQPGTTDAWMFAADKRVLFEATNITKFDGLTAGKRDAWTLMVNNTPIDFGRNAMRKAVEDVWGNDAASVLTPLREKATRGQSLYGGNVKVSSTISGLDRAFTGQISSGDITDARNLP